KQWVRRLACGVSLKRIAVNNASRALSCGVHEAFITYGTSDEALAAKEACDRKLVFPESE
ncbi:unnamed protein product, partial [Durusdinium trenchii]